MIIVDAEFQCSGDAEAHVVKFAELAMSAITGPADTLLFSDTRTHWPLQKSHFWQQRSMTMTVDQLVDSKQAVHSARDDCLHIHFSLDRRLRRLHFLDCLEPR